MRISDSDIQIPKYPCRQGHKHLTPSAASGCDALRWAERLRELGLPTEPQAQEVAKSEPAEQLDILDAIREAENR